jgi:hypothetical protein
MFTRILIALFVVLAGFWLYVRFAPNDPARWHVLPDGVAIGDRVDEGGFTTARRMTAPAADVLAAVTQAANATARTQLVAGSVQDGLMTFQTRSRLWGFPDHTTIGVQGNLVVIHGRLRFGRSDLGVNKARIENWLAVLGPLTEPL